MGFVCAACQSSLEDDEITTCPYCGYSNEPGDTKTTVPIGKIFKCLVCGREAKIDKEIRVHCDENRDHYFSLIYK